MRPGLAAAGCVGLAAASLQLAICQACICHKSRQKILDNVKGSALSALRVPAAFLGQGRNRSTRGLRYGPNVRDEIAEAALNDGP